MRLRRNRRFHAEVATGSLTDIMFFLMLFFLIVSTVANPNVIRILLPKTTENSEVLTIKKIALTVTADKHYFIEKREVAFANLETEILNEKKNVQELTVVLRLPADLQIQDLVDVMQIGAKNKIKMVLATDKK